MHFFVPTPIDNIITYYFHSNNSSQKSFEGENHLKINQ